MSNSFKVTVGIPAYNEEQNIEALVKDILAQNQTNFSLEKIVVASDGSEDRTVEILNNLNNPLVQVLDNVDRMGIATRLNQLIENSSSDCLVILNADTRIKDPNTLNKVTQPITQGYDLTSGRIVEESPTTFFERILIAGSNYKNLVVENYKNGNNYFTCHGPMRALSKNFYTNLKFDYSAGEDAYSYLYCIKAGYKYKFVPEAEIFYRLPTHFKDHVKQTDRYVNLKQNLLKSFDENFSEEQLALPKVLFFTGGIKMFFKDPIYSTLYALVTGYIYLRYKSKTKPLLKEAWDISVSSKAVK